MAKAVKDKHGGEIPADLKDLVKLPGVGRKTANVVLGDVFEVPGVVVDTHVGRLSLRLGLVDVKRTRSRPNLRSWRYCLKKPGPSSGTR
jgi:endonuclease III